MAALLLNGLERVFNSSCTSEFWSAISLLVPDNDLPVFLRSYPVRVNPRAGERHVKWGEAQSILLFLAGTPRSSRVILDTCFSSR